MKRPTKTRYLRIDDTVYESVAFKTLPGPAAKLWLDLRTQLNGSNNGRIVATLARLRRRGWNSNDTLHRAREELVSRGLLRYTRRSGPNVFHRASLLAFTDLPVPDNDEFGIAASNPTHYYLKWTPSPTTKKAASRITVKIDTVARCDTEPSPGEREVESGPRGGDHENDREGAPMLGRQEISTSN